MLTEFKHKDGSVLAYNPREIIGVLLKDKQTYIVTALGHDAVDHSFNYVTNEINKQLVRMR